MAYKISGTKNATARVMIFKESDWSIESNTIVSGTGSYEIDSLVSGTKTVIAESASGELLGYGYVDPEYYAPPAEPETATFYFATYTSSDWTNPGNMVDGNNTTTYASVVDGGPANFYQYNNVNTSSDQGGTISKVEVRIVYGYSADSPGVFIYGIPYFSAEVTQGSNYNFALSSNPPGAGPLNSGWQDITNDASAPETWTWSEVSMIDLRLWAQAQGLPGTYVYVYQCDLRVTYTPSS